MWEHCSDDKPPRPVTGIVYSFFLLYFNELMIANDVQGHSRFPDFLIPISDYVQNLKEAFYETV
jgi:hypothetical protein